MAASDLARRRRWARSAAAGRRRGGRRAPAAAARAAGAAPPRSGPRRRPSRRARPRPAQPSWAPRARLCAMVAIDCSTVASVGEPTLTRNGVWMNEGTPRSAQPGGEQRVLPRVAGGELPAARVADEHLHGARRRRRRCRRRPPLARPPLIWMCAPIGGTRGGVLQGDQSYPKVSRIVTEVPCSTTSPASRLCRRTRSPKNSVDLDLQAGALEQLRSPRPGSCRRRRAPSPAAPRPRPGSSTVLPYGAGPRPAPGLTAMTSPVSTSALRPSVRSTVKPELLEVAVAALGGLAR